MGANSFSLKPVAVSAWLLLATLAVWGSYLDGVDRIAALISALLLGISIVYSRYRLGLHHTSGPMFYLLLFGLFHLGLLAPWATGSSSSIVLVPYDQAYQEGFEDMPRRVPDLVRTRELVGYQPSMDLDLMLRAIAKAIQSELADRGEQGNRQIE